MTCAKRTVLAVIVAVDGSIYYGTNYCMAPQKTCPRIEGEGYQKCTFICVQSNHAEVNACLKAGDNAMGATMYLFGHTYACDNCKQIMKAYGIKELIIPNDNRV